MFIFLLTKCLHICYGDMHKYNTCLHSELLTGFHSEFNMVLSECSEIYKPDMLLQSHATSTNDTDYVECRHFKRILNVNAACLDYIIDSNNQVCLSLLF